MYREVLKNYKGGGRETIKEEDYMGREALYLGYIDGEGRKHGPGTITWRRINPNTKASEVEFDEGMWSEDLPDGMFH